MTREQQHREWLLAMAVDATAETRAKAKRPVGKPPKPAYCPKCGAAVLGVRLAMKHDCKQESAE